MLHLLNKRLEELSDHDIQSILKQLNIDLAVTPELKDAALALLKGESIETVADLAGSKEAIAKVVSFFQAQPKPEEVSSVVVRCPHCLNFFQKSFV